METHNARVEQIATEVRSFYIQQKQFRIYHGTTCTTRRTKLYRSNVIDTSNLNHFLDVNIEKRTALVEPNISMEQLIDATLPLGYIPPVVMEFPAITVGGGFSGTSGESSSFRYGVFDKTITSIDIILADGEIVHASNHERKDLFDAAAGSFGTFGVIVLLEIQLIPAGKYVRLTYTPTRSAAETIRTTEEIMTDPNTQYLEGILFGLHKGVVISGHLTDVVEASLSVSRFTRPQDPWFYLHAEQMVDSNSETIHHELIPIKDYLFRYDRAAFWAGRYAFEYFLVPITSFTRWLLDGWMKTKVMYHALHKSHIADQYIVQDIGFPYATVESFIQYVHHRFGFYPLWLCPLKIDPEMSLHPRTKSCFAPDARSPGMMMNVGLWGPGPKQYDHFILTNREIERKTAGLGGLKCFYAQAFYTADEFWRLYDKEWYDRLRDKYRATGLRSVYEKVTVDLSKWQPVADLPWGRWMYEKFKEQWPVRGAYGVVQLFLGSEYLLA